MNRLNVTPSIHFYQRLSQAQKTIQGCRDRTEEKSRTTRPYLGDLTHIGDAQRNQTRESIGGSDASTRTGRVFAALNRVPRDVAGSVWHERPDGVAKVLGVDDGRFIVEVLCHGFIAGGRRRSKSIFVAPPELRITLERGACIIGKVLPEWGGTC